MLQYLPHVHLPSKFQRNPETVHLREVRAYAFETKYIERQCKYLEDTEKGDYQYQDPKAYESILYSVNSVLVDLGSRMNWQICSIATPSVSDILEWGKFVSHSRHLKESAELISELWYIGIKKEK